LSLPSTWNIGFVTHSRCLNEVALANKLFLEIRRMEHILKCLQVYLFYVDYMLQSPTGHKGILQIFAVKGNWRSVYEFLDLFWLTALQQSCVYTNIRQWLYSPLKHFINFMRECGLLSFDAKYLRVHVSFSLPLQKLVAVSCNRLFTSRY
jgi:hypothetical protein